MKVSPYFFLFSVALSSTLVGCGNKVNFANPTNQSAFSSSPDVPPVQDTPPPVNNPPVDNPPPVVQPSPTLQLKSGVCPLGSSEQVLSCLSCSSQAPVVAPPLLSVKAQRLLDIMTVGCSVQNASDAANYAPPTRDQIMQRLIQCSATAYPDTTFTGTQSATIQALLTIATVQQLAFSSLYYNAASPDFETYFGLEIAEARNTLCRGQSAINPGGVYPPEYYDAQYSGLPYTLPTAYVKAQQTREQLRNCMRASLTQPPPSQAPASPGVTCSYESAEGVMSQLVTDKANEWLAKGQKVYYEGANQCGEVQNASQLGSVEGNIKIATQVCQ